MPAMKRRLLRARELRQLMRAASRRYAVKSHPSSSVGPRPVHLSATGEEHERGDQVREEDRQPDQQEDALESMKQPEDERYPEHDEGHAQDRPLGRRAGGSRCRGRGLFRYGCKCTAAGTVRLTRISGLRPQSPAG